jgi:malonyl-CoA O-methyltransferase
VNAATTDIPFEPAASPVVASFDRAAGRYRRHARIQIDLAGWLAEWLPTVRRGRALEVGAGSGVFTERLIPWDGELLATDASAAMCAVGRAAVPQAVWCVMAAEMLEGSGWDWIFSSSMLQWAAQPVDVLRGWRNRLARDGRILAGLYVDETLPELGSLIGAQTPVAWRSVETWRAALAAAGLQLQRDAVERRVYHYASAMELWRGLHALGAAPERRVSAGQLRTWLREYDRRFATEAGARATWTFYRFEARRA